MEPAMYTACFPAPNIAHDDAAPMTILVVDDDDDFRTAFADALREDGHRVEDLSGAPSAAVLRSLHDVNVVVTDYHMPGQDGLTFADAFHDFHPDTPVIVVTSDPSGSLEAAVERRPKTILHRKPFTYSEVLEVITAAHKDGA